MLHCPFVINNRSKHCKTTSKYNSELHLYQCLLLLLLHPFNSLFSSTTWVSQYQKGKTSLDLNQARDDGGLGWQSHQLDHMQTTCISLQTDNHTNTSSFNFIIKTCKKISQLKTIQKFKKRQTLFLYIYTSAYTHVYSHNQQQQQVDDEEQVVTWQRECN